MGKDHTNYYRVKFTAYAELNDERVDIAGFKATYGLDEIPTITIWPTVGRDPANDKEAEAVKKFLEAIEYTPLKVYAKFETELDNPESGEPGFPYDEDTLIFEGFLMGVTYESSRSPTGGAMRLKAEGAHWLTALAGTDSHTAGTTLKGPAGWAELANPEYKGAGINLFDIQAAITTGKTSAVTNLWLEYIKIVFQSIIGDEAVWGDAPNDAARYALDKMDDQSSFSGDASNRLKLEFGGGSLDIEYLAEFMTQFVSKTIFETWRHTDKASLWAVLKSLAKEFRFRIVPLIESASCCPVYGALGGEPYRTITADDYHSINLTTNAELLITKYAVIGGKDVYSVTRSKNPRSTGLIGLFDINQDIRNEFPVNGQTILQMAPMWIAAETEIGTITRESLGGRQFGIPDASNPDAFAGELEKDYQKLYNEVRTSELGDNFAQAMLQETNLAPRAGALGGRFRMDIAPGSMIKFEVIDDTFADSEAQPQYMYGTITHVTLNLDAGRSGPIGNASTEFSIGWVRNEVEHESDVFTESFHPLWADEKFLGTKLWKE